MDGKSTLRSTFSTNESQLSDDSRRLGHVLVAVRDVDVREYVNRLLAPYYRVTITSPARGSIPAAIEDLPHLILTDVTASDAEGAEFLSAIGSDYRTDAIPLLHLSIDSSESTCVETPSVAAYDSLALLGTVGKCLTTSLLSGNGMNRTHLLQAEAEQQISQFVEQLPAAFYVCDAKGRLTFLNRTAARLYGNDLRLGQDLTTCPWQFWRLDGTQLRRNEFPLAQLLREERQTVGEEIIIERPDGSRCDVLLHAEPLYDASARLVGAVSMLVDVTEYKRVEHDQALLSAIVESSSDAILSTTSDGRITSWNAGAQQVFGYSAQEVLGRPIAMIIPNESAAEEQANLERVKGGTHIDHYETIRLRKGGSKVDVSLTLSPIRNKEGRIIGASIVARDITERRRAEAELRDSEERFRTFAMNVPVAIFIKDLDGRYTLANPLACEALGRPDGVIGMTDHDLLPTDVADRLRERDLEVIATGCPGERVELVARDGFHRDYLTVKFPLINAEGQPVGVCGVATDITDRKRDQEALAQSEERFRTLTSHAPVGIFMTGSDGGTIFVNESWCAMTGLTREQARGSGWEVAIHPEDRERILCGWADAVRHGVASNADFRFLRPDGVITWLQGTAVPLHNPTGALIGYIGTVMDISARKWAEEELNLAKEQLRLVTDSMAVAVTRCTADLRYRWVNPGYASLLSRPREEIVGRHISEIIGQEGYKTIQPYVQRVLSGERVEYEVEIAYRNVGPRWVKGSYVPTYGDGGRPDGWVAVILDITEQKRNEEALRTSERLYRAIGESNDYGVWICDPEGRNIYASDSFLQLIGMTQEECANLGWTNSLHPDDTERTTRAWNECVRRGGPWDIEHRFRGVDGKWHPILARGVPVKNERGEITAWAGINLDISRLKRVEDELREAHSRKDEFLALLAHELRNPLAPIRTGLDLMRLEENNRDLIENVRAMMERQVDQMIRLIDDLLDISRITRGTIELRKCRVDVSSVIETAVETARPAIEESHHRLTVSLPAQAIVLNADPTRLAQAVSNLLSNAAKYMGTGGSIDVTAQREGRTCIISVKDSGIGIPPDMIDRVFDMFIQVDRSQERSRSGLGIGLTLAKRLVAMHGGTIEARSDGPGRGAEFIVRLPSTEEMVLEQSRHDEFLPRPREHRILVADDNEAAAEVLAALLNTLGNDVRVAYDGQTALDIASEFHPDIALLDLGMPKLDGYEVARQIRKEPWGSNMVLAALTGWGQEEDKRRTKKAGFDHHLVKPVESKTLQRLLAD